MTVAITPADPLDRLLADVRACRICEAHLPLGPRPVVRASMTARLVICGQAPGTRVHNTGIPFNDPSGDRLRAWMGIDRETFYDEARISIIPMGFCYPGRDPRGGDLPPRPECAAAWHARIFARLPRPHVILAIGKYAQDYHLAGRAKASVTETVRSFADYAPEIIPLPHPSPRNMGWLKRNPWFEAEVLPVLRAAVAQALSSRSSNVAADEIMPGQPAGENQEIKHNRRV